MKHLQSRDDLVSVLGAWPRRPGPLYARLAEALRAAPDDLFLDHLRLCFAVEPDLIR